jgi:transcriptional regulator with XRE-family HTH domain
MPTRGRGEIDASPRETPNGINPQSRDDLSKNGATHRVRAIMAHIPWYSTEGPARLAKDLGVSRSTISRLLRGDRTPTPRLAEAVTAALSRRLGRTLPIEEVFSPDGQGFPTGATCRLCGICPGGCMPDAAYDAKGNLRPEYQGMRPGDWCRYPTVSKQLSPSTPIPGSGKVHH